MQDSDYFRLVMDKKRLFTLVIVSLFSMILFIAIQVYWIKTSFDTQQKKFDQTVMLVMRNVVTKLEREEAITKVTTKLLDQTDFAKGFGMDTALNLGSFSINKGVKKNPLLKENFQINQTPVDQLKIQFTPPKNTDSTFFIIRNTKKRVLSSNVNYRSSSLEDSLLERRIKNNATLINNLVNELALISVSKNINNRVSYNQIDSMLHAELFANGIQTDYIYDILDVESNSLSIWNENVKAETIRNSPYQYNLYPNEFYVQSDKLLLYFPNQINYLLKNSFKVLAVSVLLIIILITLFYYSLSTIYKQKRLSQIKNDFINNMTHELKTPISTISLACEALDDQSLQIERSQQKMYVGMINDENKRLSLLVDNVLKSAIWDSSNLKLNKEPLDIHTLIEKVAKSFKIQVKKKNGKIHLDLNATTSTFDFDTVHMSNVIYNLLDNANKYSKDTPNILLQTKNTEGELIVSVKDNGIGIPKEHQNKIFDKFYRISTGNVHDVKGFGLGLSYVKRIIDNHHGKIWLESVVGSGTTISFSIPIENE